MSALREALDELPAVVFADVLESETAYVLVLDLPGVTAEAAELSFERYVLSVEAKREKEVPEEFEAVVEGRADELTFELPVPRDANGSEAVATMRRGVLEITLPKQTETSTTTIPVTE